MLERRWKGPIYRVKSLMKLKLSALGSRKRRPARARFVGALVGAALVAMAVPSASSAPTGFTLVGKLPINLPKDASQTSPSSFSLIMNPAARRAYNLVQLNNGRGVVRILDLDRLVFVSEVNLPLLPPGQRPATPRAGGSSVEWLHAIDYEKNVLYLGFLEEGLFGGVVTLDGNTLKTKVHRRADATDPTESLGCTAPSCLPQVSGAAPTLLGMGFVPSLLTGAPPKLLFLLQEPKAPGMERNFNQVWVSQWDAGSGRQDWIYRVSSCSGHQLPEGAGAKYQLAVFQARRSSGIYLGCQASGGTGQVVRLTVDSSNRPISEQAYPGPRGVVDVLADSNDDRVLMRVVAEEGESWWVFGGASSSYTGVVGVTLSPAATSAGIDISSGRLYVLAPPTNSGRQRNQGGLLRADVRRAPVPQAVADEEHAALGGVGIQADSHPVTGERRVFVMSGPTREYSIYRDDSPMSFDPLLTDLDRFTIDSEEQDSMTGVNFTGTGHAYALRTLLVGGLEGVPPGGPDLSGIRAGRHSVVWLDSPCGKGDRELSIGVVRQVVLSNNLSSASAVVGEADPGSKIDLGQPAARCYPHPRPVGFDPLGAKWPRPLNDSDGDGTSDVDEAAGQPWPFRGVECAGEGEGAEQHPSLEGFAATVNCRQNAGDVNAAAWGQVLDRPTVPGVGSIAVGEVSSVVRVYRDPARGLVARAEATVRNVSIGDAILIDSVRSVAESWAHGRPGTAATSFTRQLCGVRIPSQNLSREGCGDPQQPALGQQPVLNAINQVLGSRGRATAPEPDGQLRQGTPGGYLASIQKDRMEQISARSINNDPSSQVPAIEIVVFNDDPSEGRGRQIYQFAGVDASVTYGIFLLGGEALADSYVDLPGALADLIDTSSTQVVSMTPKAPTRRGPISPVQMFFDGLKFLLRSPGDAILAAVVWAVLIAPVFFAIRRRALKAVIG